MLLQMGYVISNGRISVNDEWEWLQLETIMTYFKVLFHDFPGLTKKNHE
jgi:hypothetical protein